MTSAAAAAFNAPVAAAAPAPVVGAPAAPAVAATPAAATPAAPAAPAANSAWYDSIANADTKTWVQSKGFQNAEAVADSAFNLEKLIGHDRAGRTLVIPKDDATPQEIQAFNAKLGVPEKPEGYTTLKMPENADPKLLSTIQGWMHKAGVTPKSAEALTAEFLSFSQAQHAQQETTLIANSDKAFAEATTAWGKEADANLALGKQFTAQLLPPEVTLDNGTKVSRQDFLEKIFNTTGATRAMLEMFAKAGKGMGEHIMRTNGQPGSVDQSPGAAQQKIAALKGDAAWVKSYLAGDKAKAAEMTRLTQLANPVTQ